MKRTIIGSLIGIAIVIAADIIIRVLITLLTEAPMNLFRYDIYPGFIWGFIISLLTLITSFTGAAFTITYADEKKKFGLFVFAFWMVIVRYGQIHYVMDFELFLPILSLILSLIGIGLAWKFFLKKKMEDSLGDETKKTQKSHHQPDTTPW